MATVVTLRTAEELWMELEKRPDGRASPLEWRAEPAQVKSGVARPQQPWSLEASTPAAQEERQDPGSCLDWTRQNHPLQRLLPQPAPKLSKRREYGWACGWPISCRRWLHWQEPSARSGLAGSSCCIGAKARLWACRCQRNRRSRCRLKPDGRLGVCYLDFVARRNLGESRTLPGGRLPHSFLI